MSFHAIDQTSARLNRSERAPPGSLTQIPEKAPQSDVDVIFFDPEDAKGHSKPIGFQPMIETALGMHTVTKIAAASKQNESPHFEAAGKGAVSLDGRRIDYASIRQAGHLALNARQGAAG